MKKKMGYSKQLLSIILILFTSLIISGCAHKVTFQKYMQPELLYLKEQPYSQIYIEVDSVEGVEVTDEWLDTLKIFLESYCSKPNGIKIKRDEPIPFDDIKDLPIGPASILCTNGPDPNSGPQSAYLHVFFYNKEKIFTKTRKEPHVILNCPSTIFYNVDYGYRLDKLIKFALPHEAGHVLGLYNNESHGDGMHCTNKKCLMNQSPGQLESLGFCLFGIPLKAELCSDCANDLANYKTEGVDPNLTFDGPFLIRRENGYSVATLPYCVLLIPDAYKNNFDWQNTLISIKKHSQEKKFKYFYKGIFILKNEDGSPSDKKLYKDTFVKAANDPDPEVQIYAAQMLETLE